MRLSVKEMVIVSMFAALACAGGLILRFGGTAVVPFSILPFIALLSGMLLGGRLAAMSMIIYLALGLAGVPVFGALPYGGLAYLVKPTAGFLFGFVGGALITGMIVKHYKVSGFFGYLLASLAGIAAIYAIGLPYLYGVMNFYVGKAVNVEGVLKMAFVPYIGLDLIKACVAAAIAVPVSKQVKTIVRA